MFERGAPKRRGVPSNNRFDEHITLIGGMNLVREATPPIYVITGKQVTPACGAKVKANCPKYPDLPRIAGKEVRDGFAGCGANGGVTQHNMTDIMVSMIDYVFDPSDVKGNRVLWAIDWHGSRFSLVLIDEL